MRSSEAACAVGWCSGGARALRVIRVRVRVRFRVRVGVRVGVRARLS